MAVPLPVSNFNGDADVSNCPIMASVKPCCFRDFPEASDLLVSEPAIHSRETAPQFSADATHADALLLWTMTVNPSIKDNDEDASESCLSRPSRSNEK